MLLSDLVYTRFTIGQVVPVPYVDENKRRLVDRNRPVQMRIFGVGLDPIDTWINVPAIVAR